MARKIKEREGAPMDTSDSSKSHGSEFGTLEDTHESNNDDLTNTALAAKWTSAACLAVKRSYW